MEKVILITIDGMRPDGALACGNDYVKKLMHLGGYSLTTQTVMPSITLPTHMSMFHSVVPQRHGIITNDFTSQVHSIKGIFETVKGAGKTTAMYYGWHNLRDLCRPGNINYGAFIEGHVGGCSDLAIIAEAKKSISTYKPDFAFIYLEGTDMGGHDYGWMSKEYLGRINDAFKGIEDLIKTLGEEYHFIVTADHGGHERMHGTTDKEDMTIPQFYYGKKFTAGKEYTNVSILDVAPTISDILGIGTQPEWDGTSILKK